MHSIREAAELLDWERRQVVKWMRALGMDTARDPYDGRPRLLSMEQIEALRAARAEAERPRGSGATLLAQIEARVAELEARVRALEGREMAPRARRVSALPALASASPAPSERHVRREGRATLPAGYISESRYVDYHSRDPRHPIQTRSLQRLALEGTLPAREQPPEGMVWRSEAGQRVRHAFSREAHLAISRFAAREWPDLFQPCAECRAAVAEEVALTAVARASGEP